jgi:TetR/AcrR family transcriptional regulator, transcriptional repressor for nem operon
MRYAAGQKDQTRARILKAAGKVFRRQGYHAAGVDKVMGEAGLTAGGFYAHFPSKEALLAEALGPAAAQAGIELGRGFEGAEGPARVEAFVDGYLAPTHRDEAEDGCPLPALVSEVGRAGESVKASFEAIVRDLAARLRDESGGVLTEDRALAIIALCVGGLGVARSVRDEALGSRILAACRELARVDLAGAVRVPEKPGRKRKRP